MAQIKAESECDIVDAVHDARACHSTFEIVNRGTKRAFGLPARADDILDVSALGGIVSYEPEELVLTAKAGTSIAEIENATAERGQRLGFDPADWGPVFAKPAGQASIGGVLSADASGSARVRYGAARDHILGYRAVNGLGEAYKAGGRVVKNVTGFDLSKLMCGAMGTLSVLTEVTLRLVPRAPMQTTCVVRNIGAGSGLALLRRAQSGPLGATGLAYLPGVATAGFQQLGDVGAGAALVRVEGSVAALDEKVSLLHSFLPAASWASCDDESIFRDIGNGSAFANRELDVWRIFVPPSRAIQFLQYTKPDFWLADWAGALLWIGTPPNDLPVADRLRGSGLSVGENALLMKADDSMRRRVGVFPALPPQLAKLHRSVKEAFDPQGIFNPGRMYEDM